MDKKSESREPESAAEPLDVEREQIQLDRGQTEEALAAVRGSFDDTYRELVFRPGFLKADAPFQEQCLEAILINSLDITRPSGACSIDPARRLQLLVDDATNMSDDDLRQLLSSLLALSAQRAAASVSADEGKLIAAINESPPHDLQERFDHLVKKRDDESLTEKEYQELLTLTEAVEAHDVARVEALTMLAATRGISLAELMRDMQFANSDE